MLGEIGSFVLGAVLLLLGTDSLIRGSAGLLARRVAETYPVALAGAVLAALLPSLAVTVAAALLGQSELALGGLIGGAIAQLGLVLGLAALVAPLMLRLKVFAWINPALLAAGVLIWLLGLDRVYSPIDGAILVAAFIAVAILVLRAMRTERASARALFDAPSSSIGSVLLFVRALLGIVLVALGAWLLVVGSIGLAGEASWSPLIVGLVALGAVSALASAPNALSAARRGHGDFAVGQAMLGALGNILLLLGALAIWHPLALAPSLGRFEIPALFALALAVYPMMRSDGELSRREGGVLLAAYVLFVLAEFWLTLA